MPSIQHLKVPTYAGATCISLCALSFPAVSDEKASEAMEIMVVTASGHEQLVTQAPASISVIDREQIENRSYRDLTDAIRDLPGVVVTGGGSRQEISLRGMPSDYTAILVDGRKQSGRQTQVSSGGGFEQDWLPPLSAIERIEVVRGPMSTLYGSDAIGGVINVITRRITSSGMVVFVLKRPFRKTLNQAMNIRVKFI